MASRASEASGPSHGGATIEFTTDGRWTADELSRAIGAIDQTYNAFVLAAKLAAERREERDRIRREFGEARRPIPEFFPPYVYRSRERLERFFDEPRVFLSKGERLSLVKIHIASPGGFSFRGLGEPLRELREFFRDIFYRNRLDRLKVEQDLRRGEQELRRGEQELALGEIEILRKKLRLRREFDLTTDEFEEIEAHTLDQVSDLRELVEDGKLSLGPGPDEPGSSAPPGDGTEPSTGPGLSSDYPQFTITPPKSDV